MNATLTVDGKVLMQRCTLYAHYCAVLNLHHICPASWWEAAGKPVDTPLIELCPDCHMNSHAAIDGIIRSSDISALPPRCVALAKQAFVIATANGLTPKPTL